MGGVFGQRETLATIPSFISALTPEGLRRAMLKNNLRQKGFLVYQFIQWVPEKKRWYAWYYIDEATLEQQEKQKQQEAPANG